MCIGVATSRTSEPKTFALLPKWYVISPARNIYVLTDDDIYV